MKPALHVIIGSTRPGRIGPAIAAWVADHANAHGAFAARLIDIAVFNLPLIDEPHHPVRRQYQHAHTKAWSASVAAADAVVLVSPEYNFGPSPALLNALDSLYLEWNYMPAGVVGYGGPGGGVRALARVMMTATALKMMPPPETVALYNVFGQIEAGVFKPTDANRARADAMLAELGRWEEALRPLRARHRAAMLPPL